MPHALQALALSTADLVAGAAWYANQQPAPDPLAERRVAAERQRALARYARDRDVAALEREMARLDAEQTGIRSDVGTASPPDWSEVVKLVRDLPALWSDPDANPEDRRALAEASFESVDALGARRLAFTMNPPAAGVQAVVMVGARGFEPPTPWPPAKCAARLRHAPTERPV